MGDDSPAKAGSFPFYHQGPHHSKSYENMPRYERRQGCVPQVTDFVARFLLRFLLHFLLSALAPLSAPLFC